MNPNFNIYFDYRNLSGVDSGLANKFGTGISIEYVPSKDPLLDISLSGKTSYQIDSYVSSNTLDANTQFPPEFAENEDVWHKYIVNDAYVLSDGGQYQLPRVDQISGENWKIIQLAHDQNGVTVFIRFDAVPKLTVNAGNVSWTAVPAFSNKNDMDGVGYQLYRDSTSPDNLIYDGPLTSFDDTGANPATTHTYYVRAYDSFSEFLPNDPTTGQFKEFYMPFSVPSNPSVPPAPIIKISPNSGTTAGGTSVTITGTGTDFSTTTPATMTIGSPATNVHVINSKEITASTTANAAGPADVVVDSNGYKYTLPHGFTYTTQAPSSTTPCFNFLGISPEDICPTLSVPSSCYVFGTPITFTISNFNNVNNTYGDGGDLYPPYSIAVESSDIANGSNPATPPYELTY